MNAELIQRGGSAPNRRVPLRDGVPHTLGRDDDCELVLPSPLVSRRHAVIRIEGGLLEVTDLKSRHGTWVRGKRVAEDGALLENGETLTIAGFDLTLKTPEGSTPAEPDRRLSLPGYEQIAELGKGASARVYSAVKEDTGQVVAVKVLTAEQDDDRIRFEREARIMSELECDSVVRTLDFLESNSTAHLVLEFVNGLSLQEAAPPRGLPLARVATIGRSLGEALAYLHEAGIVHRDVKPSNVLLSYAGEVKLIDLGIAREADSVLTSAGQGLGTLTYMAPEQLGDACSADDRSDLYGLGATLYYAITGAAPFKLGKNLRAGIRMVRTQAPLSPALYRRELPGWLDELVMKLLSKAPKERGDSAAELLPTLRRWEQDLAGSAPPDDLWGAGSPA